MREHNMESKEDLWKTWKTLWKWMKNHGWARGTSLTLSWSLLCKEESRFFDNGNVLPQRIFFFTSLSYPNFLTFSLLFSLGPCPNGLITCSSYSPRNVTRYTRTGVKPWFLHLNLKIATVLCNDWRREKACQC